LRSFLSDTLALLIFSRDVHHLDEAFAVSGKHENLVRLLVLID
jgi:hypothetical protein